MRKKRQPEHANHERWLVSYADFITLLFAFFVVMFASSQTDKAKAQQVSDSVKTALEKGGFTAAVREVLGGTVDDKGKGNALMKGPGGARQSTKEPPPDTRVADLLPSLTYLSAELKEEIKLGKIEVRLEQRGLVISLPQATFFPSGEDSIDPSTYATVEKIAATIKGLPNPVRLEGHTDSVPIHTVRFQSNWELSSARGIAMLKLLNTQFEIPMKRMAIAGYADTAPTASNETPEGRARNRRVDIVILNLRGMMPEPGGAAESLPAKGPAPSTPAEHKG
ncbi:MAG: flagellar motor protein MotB [Bryobacteraceae bacterium]